MISQALSSSIRTAYTNNFGEVKNSRVQDSTTVLKQGDLSKVDKIKESLASGEYKVDLELLSKKIADELL